MSRSHYRNEHIRRAMAALDDLEQTIGWNTRVIVDPNMPAADRTEASNQVNDCLGNVIGLTNGLKGAVHDAVGPELGQTVSAQEPQRERDKYHQITKGQRLSDALRDVMAKVGKFAAPTGMDFHDFVRSIGGDSVDERVSVLIHAQCQVEDWLHTLESAIGAVRKPADGADDIPL